MVDVEGVSSSQIKPIMLHSPKKAKNTSTTTTSVSNSNSNPRKRSNTEFADSDSSLNQSREVGNGVDNVALLLAQILENQQRDHQELKMLISNMGEEFKEIKTQVDINTNNISTLMASSSTTQVDLSELSASHELLQNTVSSLQLKISYLTADKEHLIAFGITESDPSSVQPEDLASPLTKLLTDTMKLTGIQFSRPSRLGKIPTLPPARPRPVKFLPKNQEQRKKILEAVHLLKDSEYCISACVPKDVREHRKKLKTQRATQLGPHMMETKTGLGCPIQNNIIRTTSNLQNSQAQLSKHTNNPQVSILYYNVT